MLDNEWIDKLRAYQLRQLIAVERELHIDLDACDEVGDSTRQPLQTKFQTFLAEADPHKVCLLLADAGGGKSSSLRRLTYQLWQSYRPGDRIPLLIRLDIRENPWQQLLENYLTEVLGRDAPLESLRQLRWNLLLDCYDELAEKNNPYNTNRFNELNVKVIIGCRTQSVVGTVENYKAKFVPNNISDSPLYNQLTQIVLQPFDERQRDTYISRWCEFNHAELTREWKTAAPYLAAMQRITGLAELARNPFLLQAMLEVIQKLASSAVTEISRYDLLDAYVRNHFEREVIKLDRQKVSSGSYPDLTTGLKVFAEHLAIRMFVELPENMPAQLGVNQIRWRHGDENNPWNRFFSRQSTYKDWQRQGCLLNEKEGREKGVEYYDYEFRHKTLLEYFAVRAIIAECKHYYKYNKKTKTWHWDAEGLYRMALNQKRLNEETDLMDMIVYLANHSNALVNEFPLKEALRAGIEASAEREDITILSANCGTLLNRMRYNFAWQDLQRVKLIGSDLTDGLFSRANLSGSDLRYIKLNRGLFHGTQFDRSLMLGCEFGEIPWLETPFRKISIIAYASNGACMAIGHENWIILYKKENSGYMGYDKFKLDFAGHVSCVAFHPNSNIVAYGGSRQDYPGVRSFVSVREFEKKVTYETYDGSYQDVRSIAFSPDGKLLVFGTGDHLEYQLHIYDIQTKEKIYEAKSNAFAFSTDGRFAFTNGKYSDAKIFFFDLINKRISASINPSGINEVDKIAFSPDGKILSAVIRGLGNQEVYLWNTENNQLLMKYSVSKELIKNLVFTLDQSTLLIHEYYRRILFYSLKSNSIVNVSGPFVSCIALDPCGKYLAVVHCDGKVHFADVAKNVNFTKLKHHTDLVVGVEFHPSGTKFVSCSQDGVAYEWDMLSREVIKESYCRRGSYLSYWPYESNLSQYDVGLSSIELDPKHEFALEDTDNPHDRNDRWLKLRFHSKKVGFKVDVPLHHRHIINVARFSPDAELIVTASDDTLRLWRIRPELQDKEIAVMRGHVSIIRCVKFSPDGRWLVSGGSDHTVKLWHLKRSSGSVEVTLHWTTKHMLITYDASFHGVIGLSSVNKLLLEQHGATVTGIEAKSEPERVNDESLHQFLRRERELGRVQNQDEKRKSFVNLYRQKPISITSTEWQLTVPENYSWILIEGVNSCGRLLQLVQYSEEDKQWEVFDINRSVVIELLTNNKYICFPVSQDLEKQLLQGLQAQVHAGVSAKDKLTTQLKPIVPNKNKWQNFSVNQALAVSGYDEMKSIDEVGYSVQLFTVGALQRACLRINARINLTKDQFNAVLEGGLAKCKFQHDVDLSNNNIEDDNCIQIIANWLQSHTSIRILRLSHNRITLEQLEMLLQVIKTHPTLEQVLLDYNYICFDGGYAERNLLPAISASRLINLDLSMNYIHKGAVIKERIDRGKEVVIIYQKSDLATRTDNRHRFCKTMFLQDPRLNCHYLTPSRSLIASNDFEIDQSNGVIGLFAYKCEGKRFPFMTTGEHAFLVIEGISRYGQRYILMGDLRFILETKKIAILFSSVSPKEYFGRIRNEESQEVKVYKKCAKASRSQLKAIEATILEFRNKQEMVKYSSTPNVEKNEYSCLTWAMEMLCKAEIVDHANVGSWMPSWEVGNADKCVIS